SEITPGLFIARAWDAKAARFLREYGITSIVSLEGKVPLVNGGDDFEMLPHPEWDYPENRELVPGDRHLFVHVSRYRYINVLPILSGVCDFIDKQLGCDSPSLSAGASAPDEEGQLDDDQVSVASADSDASTEPGKVVVSCRFGFYQSPTIVRAYLMRIYRKPFDQVLYLVRHRRLETYIELSSAVEFINQLQVWDECEYQVWEEAKNKIPKKAYQKYLDGRAWRIA
ncbi:protein-tyrosine phosphatase-like protein, partial [Podospora appendiculata]